MHHGGAARKAYKALDVGFRSLGYLRLEASALDFASCGRGVVGNACAAMICVHDFLDPFSEVFLRSDSPLSMRR